MSVRILSVILILFAIDLYVFQGVKVLIHQRELHTQRIINIIYWSVSVLCLTTIFIGQFVDWHSWPKPLRTYSFALIVIIYLSKIFVVIFLLLDDILRLFRLLFAWISVTFFNNSKGVADEALRISRLGFLVKTGFILGSIPFFSMIYGMIGGAYNFRVKKVALKFPQLPEAFAGLKIVQISDLHTGSYMGTNHLATAVDLILKENADIIFFTGDLVNDLHTEALEFREILSRLKAPMGVYSILGNHDYGDYYKWNSLEEKADNLHKLKSFHGEVGWKLMLNEHTYLEKDGQKIGLIGVENYSGHRNFSRYGDMKKAIDNYEVQPVNILLSHDPSHWDAEITNKYKFVDLMMSGHTHGFQFGVEIPGFRWSPVQYIYKQWADLYKNENQYLYVNRGLGFIGYPGRVGILPEITVFELNRS
jgi:predicted MPP superfamily phosphohydrolase